MKHVMKAELPYTVIPGPSAVITALLHLGFNLQNFTFIGFLPKRPTDVKNDYQDD
jgi:16S rRNA (cytidine1402-2'-O)-methyltransferase